MSFNGSGTFLINTSGQPVVSGTVITTTAFNALTADLATGLTTTLTKDGQTTPTANIKLGGFKLTGVGAGTASTDGANVGQIQSGAGQYVAVTGTDTILGTLTPTLTAYATGAVYVFKAAGANTGATTLNIDGLGAKSVVNLDGSALVASQIASGEMVSVAYNGTAFQILVGMSVLPGGTTNGVVYLNSSKAFTTSAGLTFDGTNAVTTGRMTANSAVIGSPTGGDKGTGTVNATALYVNGSQVFAGTGTPAGTLSDQRTILTSKTLTGGASTWVPRGSLYLSATTEMLFFSTSSTWYAAHYDSSTDTMGAVVAIASPTSSTNVLPYAVSSTSVAIAYSTATTTLNVRILSVSGSTITANTAATLVSFGAVAADIVACGSSYIVTGAITATFKCSLAAFTVSGTAVTLGSVATVYTDASGISVLSLFSYSATSGLCVYNPSTAGGLKVNGFTVSGTTITVGAQAALTIGSFFANRIAHQLSSGRFMLIAGSSSDCVANLISLSGSTATVSASANIGGYLSAGLFYSLASGTDVLLVGNKVPLSAVVFSDSSGTIATSAQSTLNNASIPVAPSTTNTSIFAIGASSVGVAYVGDGTGSNIVFTVSISASAPSVSYAASRSYGYVAATQVNYKFVGYGSGSALSGNTNYYGVSTSSTASYNWFDVTSAYKWGVNATSAFVYPPTPSEGNYYDALSLTCIWSATTNTYYNGANTTLIMTRSQYL